MRFRPEQHLRRQRDFRAVREQGHRLSCGPFTFAWLQRAPAADTTGIAASPVTAPSPASPETTDAAAPAHPAASATSSTLPALAPARVGVVASAAAVGGAVQRNRAKRRLRAIFRRHQQLVPAGCDLVLTARSALNRTEYAALEQKFVEACRVLSLGGKK